MPESAPPGLPDRGVDSGRRDLLAGLLPATFLLCADSSTAEAADLSLDEHTRTWLRLISDSSGRTTYAVTEGMVWGFKPQADDLTIETFAKRLYGYRSLVARKGSIRPDGTYALKTKAWTFYLDPASGEPVTRVFNPYSSQTVDCPPLSGPESTVIYGAPGETAKPLDLNRRRIGEHAFIQVDRLSRFKPADTTWFKLEADMTSYACRASDLDRQGLGFVPSTWSHNLVAEWQTWMKMHGTPGHILFKGDGATLASVDSVPADLRQAVARHFPGTFDAVAAWS